MGIKRYKIDYNFGEAEIHIEVDHDKVTDADLHEINNFWSGAERRVAAADGDVLKAVLVLLGQVVLWKQVESDSSVEGIVHAFDWGNKFLYDSALEGWPKMDGSMGFKLVEIEPYEFFAENFKVEEVA